MENFKISFATCTHIKDKVIFAEKIMPSSFSIFEILMLLCFACSWPLSIYKAIKTKFVLGKSPAFMMIIMIGYVFGIMHKILYQPDVVTFLWGFNLLLVTVDLVLFFYYAPKNKAHIKNNLPNIS
jgi:hypothetical protein